MPCRFKDLLPLCRLDRWRSMAKFEHCQCKTGLPDGSQKRMWGTDLENRRFFFLFFQKSISWGVNSLGAARMHAHVALVPTKEPPSGPPRIPRDLPRNLFWRWLEPQFVVRRRAGRWQGKIEMAYFWWRTGCWLIDVERKWLGLRTLVEFWGWLEPQCVVRRRAYFY